MSNQKEWSVEEIDFLKQNHEKISFREIGKILDRTHSSVENKSHKLGLKRERKYQYDMNLFKSPVTTECSAYWLGFIYADGWVSGKEIGIVLKSTDYKHLKKFNNSLKGNIPIGFTAKPERYIAGKLAQPSKGCIIRLYNKQMVLDLNALGVFSDKSLNMQFPMLDNDYLMWCFIRGYFDGDGSLWYAKSHNQLRAKITTGSESFKKSFSDFLKERNIKTYMTGIYDCGITGKECTRLFLSNMYDTANIFLDRKYEKYKEYKYLFGPNKQ